MGPDEDCVLSAEQEQGPFYVANELLRADIAEGKPGVPLRLRLVFVDQATCRPLPGAAVDLWHCDAMGVYSGYTHTRLGPPPGQHGGPEGGPEDGSPHGPPPDPSHEGPPPGGFGGPGGPGGFGGPGGGIQPTDKLTFLRGIQFTARDGSVEFRTVFPGFYEGRTNHIHMKVRLEGHRKGRTYAGGHTAHTGQIFFPEDLNVKLMQNGPYAGHRIHRTTTREDHVFSGQHGSASVATIVLIDSARPGLGYLAELRIAVNPAATPAPAGFGPPTTGSNELSGTLGSARTGA